MSPFGETLFLIVWYLFRLGKVTRHSQLSLSFPFKHGFHLHYSFSSIFWHNRHLHLTVYLRNAKSLPLLTLNLNAIIHYGYNIGEDWCVKYGEEVKWHKHAAMSFMLLNISVTTLWMKGNHVQTYLITQTWCWWNICKWPFSDRLISPGKLSPPVWAVWDFNLIYPNDDDDDDSCALVHGSFMM